MKPEDVFNIELPEKSDGTANHVLQGPRILYGKVVRLDCFYVADLTTVNRQMRLGYDRGGTQIWLKRQRAGASAFQIAQDGYLILVGGERPFGMVEDPAALDVMQLVARGVYL